MATAALEDIIGITPLTEALRATTSGIPDPFPPEFSVVKPSNRILGDRAKYTRINGARTTAKLAAYGAPGRRVPLQPISQVPFRMLFVAMEINIDANMLNKLQAFEQYVQDEGLDWLAYQISEVAKRMVNTRIVAKASMLRYGVIYWDADGNILPSAGGAAFSFSANIPANNQNQLNGIIAAPWPLANTDILGHIRKLKQQSAQDTGLRPEHCMYGLNIPLYFQTNATLQAYLARNPNWRDTLVDTGDIPGNFAGIKRWTNVSHAFFEDQNGTNQLLWDDDLCVFTPEMNQPDKMDWWGMYEGSAAVLNGFDAYADPMGAMKNLKQEYGQSGYSVPLLTPPLGWTSFFQDCWLGAIKNEKAVYQADTTF